jgi:hypothetical protein
MAGMAPPRLLDDHREAEIGSEARDAFSEGFVVHAGEQLAANPTVQ